MFDDFVEHAPSSGRVTNSRDAFENSAFAQLRAEGFEPDNDGMSVDGTELQSGEAGYTSKPIFDDNSAIFSMSKVQFSLPAELLSLQVNSNVLVAAVRPLSLIVIDLNKPADLINVDLPKPAANIEGKGTEQLVPRIASLYGDPSGRHLLISITSGDVFYLSTASLGPIASTSLPSARKPRPLRLRHTVSCVAWSPLATSTPLPNQIECLLASNEGVISSLVLPPNDDIFNLKSVSIARTYERDHTILYSLPEKRSVTGLSLGFGSTSSLSKKPQVWVVLTTSERLHLFHANMASSNQDCNMTGKNGWGEDLFKDIETQDASLRSHYVPGHGPDSMVSSFWQLSTSLTKPKNVTRELLQPSHLAWSTASGLYHFELLGNEPLSALTSATFESWTSLGSADGQKPLSILATKFHFILAFQTRLVSVSRLSGRIVWEQPFDLQPSERVLGLTSDPVKQTFWAYTSASLIEVVPKVEERNVWHLEMDRGNYEIALSYAKDQKQTDMIISRQADSLFQDQRYIQAAQAYAKCTRSFEYVALRFVDADEKDALRIYLSERLNCLPKANITQRMMLATWLIEIYLSKCNTLEDIIAAEAATGEVESLRTELSLMDEELRTFITTYQNNLEPKVIYNLIQSHGRTDIYLFFARLVKDYAIVIQHFIDEEMWHEAIDVLNRQPTLDLYYQHASVLMAHVPEETTQTWLKNSALDVKKLVPALLSSYHASNAGGQKHAIQFLTIVVGRGNTDDVVHNLLLTMLVKHEDRSDTELLRFLNEAVEDPITQRPIFDLDYALRLCKQNDRLLPCVYIYAKMGRFESGVDLALEKGDIELAKTNADKPEDDIALKRKLWLKIARHAIQDRNDIKSAIKLLEQTELLKIEDILPFFPDFTVINAFKDEICDALEDYSSQIETLRGEMDDATSSAKKIQADIENLQARFITIDANERCSRCQGLLTMRHFYVFPCQHAFHADCMISLAKEYLPSSSLRRIVHLQDELIRLSKLSRKTSLPDSRSRTLLSATTNQAEVIASVLDPANLLLGSSRKLLAAGDKLRELIVPDVLANAISIGGRGTEKAVTNVVSQENGRQTKLDDIRAEIDKVLASNCVLCEGAIVTIDQPFVSERNGDDSWDL